MTRADVLVLGGGPAGATLAALAARRGARVVVLEKKRFPRNKVCGEFLSPEGCGVLRRLGVLDRLVEAGAVRMHTFRVTDRRGRVLEAPLPDLEPHGADALGISRSRMDTILLEEARRAGAEVRERWVAVTPVLHDQRVAGVRARPSNAKGEGEEMRASIIVAADGRGSMLTRALRAKRNHPAATTPRSLFGLKAHFAGPADRLSGVVELHVFDGGYLGLSLVEDDTVNLGALVRVDALRAHGGSPERLLRERILEGPALEAVLGGRERSSRWHSVGPLRFGREEPAAAGALFVGDAAGTVDPFCGEGMSHALLGAEIALPYVLEAVVRGHLPDTSAAAYARAWDKAFLPTTRVARIVGKVFSAHRLTGLLTSALGRVPAGVLPAIVRSTRTGSRVRGWDSTA